MSDILKKIGVVLMSLLGQKAVQKIIIEMLTKYAKQTSNTVDDQVIRVVGSALENRKDAEGALRLYNAWKGTGSDAG